MFLNLAVLAAIVVIGACGIAVGYQFGMEAAYRTKPYKKFGQD